MTDVADTRGETIMRGRRNDSNFDSSKEEFDMSMITGLYPELGKETCRILRTGQGKGIEISPRDAGRMTRISFVTINNMRKGDSVEAWTLIKFANAMGANINKMLKLSGHDPLILNERNLSQLSDFVPEGIKVTLTKEDAPSDDLLAPLQKTLDESFAYAPENMRPQLKKEYAEIANHNLQERIFLDKSRGKLREVPSHITQNGTTGSGADQNNPAEP